METSFVTIGLYNLGFCLAFMAFAKGDLYRATPVRALDALGSWILQIHPEDHPI